MQSINYGQQQITITGLAPTSAYYVQLLVSDGTFNERVQDNAFGSAPVDVVDVKTNTGYDVSEFVVADASGHL